MLAADTPENSTLKPRKFGEILLDDVKKDLKLLIRNQEVSLEQENRIIKREMEVKSSQSFDSQVL